MAEGNLGYQPGERRQVHTCFINCEDTPAILRDYCPPLGGTEKDTEGKVFGPFLPRRRVEPWNGGYVLIAGGTYGYKELLDAASDSQLENVILQTGKVEPHIYSERHPEWRVFSTIDNYFEVIAGADIVVAPPGATPLEAAAYGKSIVIVRFPEWSRAGTLLDAELFANKLNAPFLSQISTVNLLTAIQQ